jgi:hypothetical protein
VPTCCGYPWADRGGAGHRCDRVVAAQRLYP